MLAGIAPPKVLAQTIARFAPGRPDAIAEVAGFPASDAARRSAGQVLHGHGGQRRRPPATGVAFSRDSTVCALGGGGAAAGAAGAGTVKFATGAGAG